MSSAQRRKGKCGELEVVKLAKDCGLGQGSKRTAPIQAGCGTSGFADCMIQLPSGEYIKAEVKRRESLPAWPWDWLQGHDVVAIRKNNTRWLGIVDLGDYFELLAKANGKETG